MRALRLVYAWSFAIMALLGIGSAMTMLTLKVSIVDLGPESPAYFGAALAGVPLVLAVPFALAWWAVFKRKPSADKWAIASCVLPVLLALFAVSQRPFRLLQPAWIPMAVGIAGIVLFSLGEARPGQARRRPARSPIPGDGTSAVVNALIHVAGVAAAVEGGRLLSHWADTLGLPRSLPPMFVLQFVLGIFLVLAIHEAGHAIAGLAQGMKLIAFVIGPFQWWRRYGRWTFVVRPGRLFVGQTLVVPAVIDGFRRRKIIQVAAGPAASLAAGLAAIAAMPALPGRSWAVEWPVIAVFANISTLAGLLNLVPFRIGNGYSDGAKLYQLLPRGLWGDYHRALGIAYSISVTPLRPRDYDIAALERAAGSVARGLDELFMYLCAYDYYFDCGRLEEARTAIEKAERFCRESGLEAPPGWYANMVFAVAYLRRDAAGARHWWERMEATKSYRFTDDLWVARCALLWAENHHDEACQAWNQASAWANGLPHTGACETERDAVSRLREVLDESPAGHPALAVPAASE